MSQQHLIREIQQLKQEVAQLKEADTGDPYDEPWGAIGHLAKSKIAPGPAKADIWKNVNELVKRVESLEIKVEALRGDVGGLNAR